MQKLSGGDIFWMFSSSGLMFSVKEEITPAHIDNGFSIVCLK